LLIKQANLRATFSYSSPPPPPAANFFPDWTRQYKKSFCIGCNHIGVALRKHIFNRFSHCSCEYSFLFGLVYKADMHALSLLAGDDADVHDLADWLGLKKRFIMLFPDWLGANIFIFLLFPDWLVANIFIFLLFPDWLGANIFIFLSFLSGWRQSQHSRSFLIGWRQSRQSSSFLIGCLTGSGSFLRSSLVGWGQSHAFS
jgi:hypothetical protein